MLSNKRAVGDARAPAAIFVAVFVYIALAFAAHIQGVVQHSLGNPLAGPALSLKSREGQLAPSTKTNAIGQFVYVGAGQGIYAPER